jgi:hypothetical protein
LLEAALANDVGPSVRRAAAIGLGTLQVDPLAPQERCAVQQRALVALECGAQDGEWVVRYAVATAMERITPRLQELEEDFAGDAAAVAGDFKGEAELPLEEPVLVAELLFLGEGEAIFALLAAAALGAVHSGRIVLPLEVFGGAE